MIVNIDNLINCVFLFDERDKSKTDQYSSHISSHYSSQDLLLSDLAAFFSFRYSFQGSSMIEEMSLS